MRIEDLDRPRVIPGSEEEILRTLERYGPLWDGKVVRQSERVPLYEAAVDELRRTGNAYDCACSRAEIARAASAPADTDQVEAISSVYPGTCRQGIAPGRTARAVRFIVPPGVVTIDDLVAGKVEQDVAIAVGDFVVQRADGPFAYQLAVVVDDANQRVSQVVRGADLLDSTARQIQLQRALGYPQPQYAHLPLVVGPDGRKLGKRDGALPLESLDEQRIASTLQRALRVLGIDVEQDRADSMLLAALDQWDASRITIEPVMSG